MFTGFLVTGGIAGSVLFAAKWVIYTLIMSIFPRRFTRWVERTPIMLILLDAGFAAMAAPVFSMAGGTIAMFSMISYTACCALLIGTKIAKYKAAKAWKRFQYHFA